MKYDIVKLMARRKIRWKKRWVSGDSGGRLTFRSKKAGRLSDYRIYGNTVDGESVGDRTGNLFDGTFIHRSVVGVEVGDDDPNRRSIVVDVSSYSNGNKITFSRETSAGDMFQMYQVSSPLKGGRLLNASVISGDSKTLLATITLDDISNYHYLMIFLNGAANTITDEELLASKIMVNVGNTSLPYEPYGNKVPVTVEGRNLINSSIYEILNTGVEYTVNNDKSITANGSTSSKFSLFLVKVYLTKGSYIISGCPQNGSQNTYRCEIRDIKLNSLAQDTGAGVTYSIVTDEYYYYSIRIAQNYVCNNLTFYPMIRRADIEDDTYEPYHAPVTTPIYLPEQIRKVGDEAEYIDYGQQKQHFADGTETDVTLPALPTLPGTNVLSVGTAVQPSRAEVKGRIKAVGQETEPEPEAAEPEQEAAEAEQEAAEPEQEEPEVKEDDTDDR